MKKKGLVFTIILILLLAFTGCGNMKSASSTSNMAANGGSSGSSQSISKDTIATSEASPQMSNTQNASNMDVNAADKSNSVNAQSSKIVKTANIDMETVKFDSTVNALLAKCSELGGYVENSNVMGTSINSDKTTQLRSANLRLRIPKDKYNAFMNSFGSLGNVLRKQETGENITDQYYDTDAHLKSLQTEEDRLLELLKKSGDLKSILDLEKELANVRYQIESLTSSLKRMDNMVDYTTFNININEVQEIKKTTKPPVSLWDKIASGFSDSISALITIFKGLLIGIAYIIPFAAVILIILGAVYYILRYAKRRNEVKLLKTDKTNKDDNNNK